MTSYLGNPDTNRTLSRQKQIFHDRFMPKLILAIFCFMTMGSFHAKACSACKITANGHTWFLNNEDNWRLGSRLWFEPGKDGQLGAAFFGYGDGLPQGGMNEAGLAYDALTVYQKKIINTSGKPSIGDREAFLRKIMTSCRTADDVARMASAYFREGLDGGVFIYVDAAGKYTIMEPDTVWTGADPHYVIANFCPSTTAEEDRLAFARYKRGKDFLDAPVSEAGPAYLLKALDTMHVCRGKIGDGTLHSYIADLTAGTIDLYFYHDYTRVKRFNLKEELAKGPHRYDIAALFPGNAEYAKLLTYQTAYNNKKIIFLLAGAFFVYALTLIISGLALLRRKAENKKFAWSMVALSLAALPLMAKMILDPGIFYFDYPYDGYWNIYNYLPLMMMVLAGFGAVSLFRANSTPSSYTLALHPTPILLTLILTAGFFYWKFFPFNFFGA